MKLNAPPPPPPGSGPDPLPELPPPVDSSSSPSVPVPAVPYQKPPERLATWPTWFGPADSILAALVLALAFLAASFTSYNSDIWLHLAAGKRLTTGDYKLGTDPFSYTAADRTWVNHSWLFDLGAYSLYSGNGFLLVLIKALVVAGAFGILLSLRRAGHSLWPWTVFAALGILASASYFTLRPYIGSVFFLAVTLGLVFRLPTRPGSWKLPIAIGITFALWSNIDSWFLLGPVALLLLFVGEAARVKLWPAAPTDASDPLGPLPDLATLGKALAVGVLACMVNPHHVRVWEIPFELLGAGAAESDPRIRIFFYAPLRGITAFWESESLAMNAGGIAYVALLVAGLYAAFLSSAIGRLLGPAAEVDPLPLPHMLLWVGFAVLSLFTMFAIPFFAIVTIPLVASRWNVFSSRLTLGFWSERKTRSLLTASSAGRLASVFGLLLLCIAAWPGWLHAPASCWWEPGLAHPAITRRVEWRVESDPDLQQAAEWLNAARTSGDLSPDVRGFSASLDFANYCAWYAPQEKVFANGRLGFHRPELEEFAKARRGLGSFNEKAEPPDPRDAAEVFKKWNAVYVAVSLQRSDREQDRLRLSLIENQMWTNWDTWSPWFFNGRTAISGWRPSKSATDSTFGKLELNPLAVAYGPNVPRLPAVKIESPLIASTALTEIWESRKPTPTGVDETLAWLAFKDRQRAMSLIAQQTGSLLRLNQPGIATPTIGPLLFHVRDEFMASQGRLQSLPAADGSFQTFPILALRAARRAIAENPDHPDGYFALARVLSDRDLPIGDPERSVSLATAYRQCLARMPKPADFKRNFYVSSPTEAAQSLAKLYLGRQIRAGEFQGHRVDMGVIGGLSGGLYVYEVPAGPLNAGRNAITRVHPSAQIPPGARQLFAGLHVLPLDVSKQLLATAEEYARKEFPDSEIRAEVLKRLGDERKLVDSAYQKALDQFRIRSERNPKLRERHGLAVSLGLLDDALGKLREADLTKEFGDDAMAMALHMIALELALGRLEDASAHMAHLRDEIVELEGKPKVNPAAIKNLRRQLAEIEFEKLVLEGNYGEAGLELESLVAESIGKYPPFLPEYMPFDLFNVGWPTFAVLATTDTPFGIFPRYWGAHIQFLRYAAIRDRILGQLEQESEFFYRRGMLALLEGDIAGAKSRFESANRPSPPGWRLPAIRNVPAQNFLKLIDRAEKAAKP